MFFALTAADSIAAAAASAAVVNSMSAPLAAAGHPEVVTATQAVPALALAVVDWSAEAVSNSAEEQWSVAVMVAQSVAQVRPHS